MAYHVLIDGEQQGPFERDVISGMVARGEFTGETLVWSDGMSDWAPAATVDDLSDLFSSYAMPGSAGPTAGGAKLAMGRALGDGFRVIVQQPLRLIGVIILYAVLSIIAIVPVFTLFIVGAVAGASDEGFGSASGAFALMAIGYATTLLLSAALYGGLCAVMLDAVRGTQLHFGRLFAGFKRIIPLFLFMLMVGLIGLLPAGLIMELFGEAMGIWVLLVLLPVIFLLVALALGPFLIMDAGAGPVDAFTGSFRAVIRLGWFRVFGTLVVLVILVTLLMLVVSLFAGLFALATVGVVGGGDTDTFMIAQSIISGLPQLLIGMGWTAVLAGVLAAIYEQARAG